MLKIFLALTDTNVRLKTAVGSKSLCFLKNVKALFYLYVLPLFSMFKIFIEDQIIKAFFFKNLAYADNQVILSFLMEAEVCTCDF